MNVLKDFELLHSDGWYSAGIHPWYINKDIEEQLASLEKCTALKNVLAVGECGLDKVCETDFFLQQKIFSKEIQLANKIQKPIIIHCVKAFDETLHQLKNENVNVPVIFHGFNKSKELANRIIDDGHYLSFGKHLLHENLHQIFSDISLQHVFFETDDTDIEISEVYKMAAEIKNISLETLIKKIAENFNEIFLLGYV